MLEEVVKIQQVLREMNDNIVKDLWMVALGTSMLNVTV